MTLHRPVQHSTAGHPKPPRRITAPRSSQSAPGAAPLPPAGRNGSSHSRRRFGWALIAGLLGVGGVVCSVLAAGVVAGHNVRTSRSHFQASSAAIASTLQLARRRT
jgi:hypothetical protein